MLLPILITIIAGYLLGNLNGAVIMYKFLTKEDIRNTGSGNAGLTNFLRKFGPTSGIWVMAIDMLKAIIACVLGKLLFVPYGYAMEGLMLGALAVSLGHDFPALLGFHGGKGIVCGFAIAIAADWRCALIITAIFAVCLCFTRYVSLSSILAALGFCISFAVFHYQKPLVSVMGVLVGVLAIFMHRSNIKRLLSGTEKKATFSQFKKKNKS